MASEEFEGLDPWRQMKIRVAKARATGSEGGHPRKFRTLYALSAPDYNMHDALGLDKRALAEAQVPPIGFPGRPENPAEMRAKYLKRSQSGGSSALPGFPNEKPLEQAPNVSRFWLHDVKNDKSGGEGLYEVMSGLVALHGQPDRKAAKTGALRSGTRFRATPFFVRGSTWLRVTKENVNAPVLSVTSRGYVSIPKKTGGRLQDCPSTHPPLHFDESGKPRRDLLHCFHDRSGTWPLSAGTGDNRVHSGYDCLSTSDETWLEDNKQYIKRTRDLDREKGVRSYSVCNLTPLRTKDY